MGSGFGGGEGGELFGLVRMVLRVVFFMLDRSRRSHASRPAFKAAHGPYTKGHYIHGSLSPSTSTLALCEICYGQGLQKGSSQRVGSSGYYGERPTNAAGHKRYGGVRGLHQVGIRARTADVSEGRDVCSASGEGFILCSQHVGHARSQARSTSKSHV